MAGKAKAPKPDKYGLMPGEREALESDQGNRCLICGRQPKTVRLHVDHCHHCGKYAPRKSIRGLLCHRCNRGLFNEDPTLYRRAALYLESHVCPPKPTRQRR